MDDTPPTPSRPRGHSRNPLRLILLLVAGVAAALLPGGAAHAGDTPGTYSNWQFDGVSGLGDVAYTITVDADPGDQSQVYWSNQVSWTNGHGGYAGLQTNASTTRRLFLFSVWDVTEARPGSQGSWCEAFGGEGEGMSCRIWHTWTPGQTYRFHYRAEGGGWWGMTVTNTSTNAQFKLGSIRVGADTMSPGSVSWTEYYRWSDPRSSCATEPYSRARITAPVGNNGTLRARVTSAHAGQTCTDKAAVTVSGSSATHVNAIGNSVMGQMSGIGGKCVNVADAADATPALLQPCDGGAGQAWVWAYDGTIRSKLFACLDANGSANGAPVTQWSCNGGANQQWSHSNGRIVNAASGKCLDAANGSSANGTRLIIWTCGSNANQQWSIPARP
ncbi:hypothetical protein GCM10010412_050460 [Nonomuraea recticatena]|uniref:Ricin B lectin domain-containing protein n=1 Tax=Nonomuraea recticatena TaxID=46178 RepID=A0ABP6EMU7_9ACTN